MGKKSKKKRLRSAEQQSTQTPAKKSVAFLNNILVTMGLLILLYALYQSVPGYKWVVDSLLITNLKIIMENPDVTTSQKYEAKLGFDYRYINYVKENTPEDAVILMPPPEVFEKSDFNKRGAWGVKTKAWNTYFLYPRVLVTKEDSITNPQLYEEVTHVMIVNEWGYDKLNYSVQTRNKYAVLPVTNN